MSARNTRVTHNLHEHLTAARRRQPAPVRTLDFAYTPDSDDAFNFYALEHGRVCPDAFKARFHREHVFALNKAALNDRYDVVGVSSVAFPAVADRYWVLSAGNSIGRGYGPVLVSKHYGTVGQLRGKAVAVAGIPTTGGALAMMFCWASRFVEMPYDRIADAIVAGEVDAGVMIHEELLYFPEKGLRRVADLGAAWWEDTGLPLPVGLNLVHRRCGRGLAMAAAAACHDSLRWGLDHYDEAFAFASGFGRGCAKDHIRMFSNADTLCLPPDARQGVRVMFDRVAALGIGPSVEDFEVIDA